MIIHTFPVGAFQVNCYVVADEATREGVLVDPGDEVAAVLGFVRREGLKIRAILLTHGHVDHVMRAQEFKESLGVPICAHPADRPLIAGAPQDALRFGLAPGPVAEVDQDLGDGQDFQAGPLTFQVLHVPGHTPGGVALVLGGCAFTGDTIFAGAVGRTDLPGGDRRQLERSIRTRIYTLPEDTVLYPGHGPATTVGEEKRSNPFVRGFDP